MSEPEVWQLSARQLRSAYASGSISPSEAFSALAERIDSLNSTVGAFTTLTLERAQEDAKTATDALAAGESRGPLHGIPVGIKELFDVGDAETTYGAPMLAGRIAPGDAAAVARLRAAGCIVMGLTRSHEFGWGITTQNDKLGSTRNPWAPDRVPGGSSGGTAAALAMGFVPVALGSDTGGSIRIPATFCGVAGLKPTYGRVSKLGAVALAPSLDHPGPLARTVGDLAPAAEALFGYEATDPSTIAAPFDLQDLEAGLEGLRVAVCPDLHLRPLWPDHQRVFDGAVAAAATAGATIEEVSFPDAEGVRPAFATIQMAEAHHYHRHDLGFYPERRSEYGADVAGRLDMASEVTLEEYIEARQTAAHHARTFATIFDSVDLLLTPVTGGGPSTSATPNKVIKDGDTVPFRDLVMDYTVPQDLAGLPACVVPAGLDDDGVPSAVQLTAAHAADALALRGSLGLERALAPGIGWPAMATAGTEGG